MPRRSSAPFVAFAALVLLLAGLAPRARAGTINVTSTSDAAPANDAVITLREALMIAAGTRIPWNDPNPDNDDEANDIIGTVGAGQIDTIRVIAGDGATIALSSPLPALSEAGDSIDARPVAMAELRTVLDGAALMGAFDTAIGLKLETANHTIQGLDFRNFRDGPLHVHSSGNTIDGCFFTESGRNGIEFFGTSATGNAVSDCRVDQSEGFGITVCCGAKNNVFESVFVTNSGGTGIWFSDAGTTGNAVRGSGIGVNPDLSRGGNGGWGIQITNGASGNRIGDETDLESFSYVSFNELGGIKIADPGTDSNVLHSLWLGHDPNDASGSGNGGGPGIDVRNGAKMNEIGQPGDFVGPNPFIVLSGHQGPAIRVTGMGTDDNVILFIFVGGTNPNVGGDMGNNGHGIEVSHGPLNTTIGTDTERQQIEIDNIGPALGPRHAIYIDGTDEPVENVDIGLIHIGNLQVGRMDPTIRGDGIHLTGEVSDVKIGHPNHPNHVNGAEHYGIRLAGPDVSDVELDQIHAGENWGSAAPNFMGGILIANGASDVTLSLDEAGADGRSYISGNKGPGITIDASTAAPSDVTIRNAWIGLTPASASLPNEGPGILIQGAMGTTPTELTDVKIGSSTALVDGCVISGNSGHGLKLERVKGVEIVGNLIGLKPDGTEARANTESGVFLDGCEDIDIGDALLADGRNVISGNTKAGVRIAGGTNAIRLRGNLIGTSEDGMSAVPNVEAGVLAEGPGPASGKTLVIGGNAGFWGGATPGELSLGEGNLISGNTGPGIKLAPKSGETTLARVSVHGNAIGPKLDGTAGFAMAGDGVLFSDAQMTDVIVGDPTTEALANLISGNGNDGVRVNDAGNWKLQGNLIGLGADRSTAVANARHGVSLEDVSSGSIGGATGARVGNVISGNTKAGIFIGEDVAGSLIVRKNYVGTDPAGMSAKPNEEGLVIEPEATTGGGSKLVIGGSLANLGQGGTLTEGNLFSGNTRAGIRVGRRDSLGPQSTLRIDLLGNFVGVNKNGDAAVPNETGIRVTGARFDPLNIGLEETADSGNLISGNTGDGVLVEQGSTKVQVWRALIGSGKTTGPMNQPPTQANAVPNMQDGIRFTTSAERNTVGMCRIYFNEESGIHAIGDGTRRNQFTNNSIHRNEEKGIELTAGANDGVKAPAIDRLYRVDPLSGRMRSKIDETGTLETFSDPLFPAGEDGAWGQGFDRQIEDSVASGDLNIPLTNYDQGFVTATLTDADGNTSEFSPIAGARVIQSVASDDPDFEHLLLAAGKRTVVRVYLNSGIGEKPRPVTGVLRMSGGAPISPLPANHELRPFTGYDGERQNEDDNSPGPKSLRRLGKDSLNFHVAGPGSGNQTFEVTLKEGAKERGVIDLGEANFQSLGKISIAVVPYWLPHPTTGARQNINRGAATKVLQYIGDAYPVSPQTYSWVWLRPRMLPGVPDGYFSQWARHRDLDVFRRYAPAEGLPLTTHVFGFVPEAVGLQGKELGSSHTSLKASLVLDTKRGQHVGSIGCHELGHTDPFLLGDTYKGGVTKDRNPVFPSGHRADKNQPFDWDGNLVPEIDFGYNTGAVAAPGSSTPPRPTGSFGARKSFDVLDFMSNEVDGWVDAPTWRWLFNGLGGNVPGLSSVGLSHLDPPQPVLVVVGLIGQDDSVDVLPLWHDEEEVHLPRPTVDGATHSVELQDAGGLPLDIVELLPVFAQERHYYGDMEGDPNTAAHEPTTHASFEATLRDLPGGARIVVKRGTDVISTIEKSDNPPDITYLGPEGPGDMSTGMATVSWTLSDPDPGGTTGVVVDVLYTPDGGVTIYPVDVLVEGETSIEVDMSELPGGPDARFIVVGRDGWLEDEDTADTSFTVSDRAPEVFLLEPSEGSEHYEDLAIGLVGTGYDPEDGNLGDAALEWFLNGDLVTPIAYGPQAALQLPVGPHTLRLVATDSEGQSSFAEVAFTVAEEEERPLVEDTNPDTDEDDVEDGDDNCPFTPNPNQDDADEDGIGDACEQRVLVQVGTALSAGGSETVMLPVHYDAGRECVTELSFVVSHPAELTQQGSANSPAGCFANVDGGPGPNELTIELTCGAGITGSGKLIDLSFAVPAIGAEPFTLHGVGCSGPVAEDCDVPADALDVDCGGGAVIVGCNPGDIHPHGLGDGVVSLADWVLGLQLLRGDAVVMVRDLACSDLGAKGPCVDELGVVGACPNANAGWDQDDVDTVRALSAETARAVCLGCLSDVSPSAARLPGDVMPRGATDEVVDVSDVLKVLRWIVGLDLDPPLSDEELLRADLSPNELVGLLTVVIGNGELSIEDVLLLLRAAVGLVDLAWSERILEIGTNEDVEAVGFRAMTSGWPAWATLSEDADPCNGAAGGWDASGSNWVLTCATEPDPTTTPGILGTIRYRAPEGLHPKSLELELTTIDASLDEAEVEGYLARVSN